MKCVRGSRTHPAGGTGSVEDHVEVVGLAWVAQIRLK